MDALSFGIPGWDSTPPSPSSPPADHIPGDASGGPRDSVPLRTSSPSPSCSHAVDMLGNVIWICPLAPGTSADVLIWDGYGPSHTRGGFFHFEVGGHDGAYKGRIHVIVPFIGRKNGTLIAPANNLTMTCTRQKGHALSCRLLGCGIGVWLRTSGVAAPMSCTSQSLGALSHGARTVQCFWDGCPTCTPLNGPHRNTPRVLISAPCSPYWHTRILQFLV